MTNRLTQEGLIVNEIIKSPFDVSTREWLNKPTTKNKRYVGVSLKEINNRQIIYDIFKEIESVAYRSKINLWFYIR